MGYIQLLVPHYDSSITVPSLEPLALAVTNSTSLDYDVLQYVDPLIGSANGGKLPS